MCKKAGVIWAIAIVLLIYIVSAAPNPPSVPSLPGDYTDPVDNVTNPTRTTTPNNNVNVNYGGGGNSLIYKTGFEISSNPTGAKLYLNGVYQGDTPTKILNLKANTQYNLELRKQGYIEYSITKSTVYGQTIKFSVNLVEQKFNPGTPVANNVGLAASDNTQRPTDTEIIGDSGNNNKIILWIAIPIFVIVISLIAVLIILAKHKKEEDPYTSELISYFKTNLNKGYNVMQIRDYLIRYGWPSQRVDYAIRLLRNA